MGVLNDKRCKNTLNDKVFLDKTIDINERYNILLLNVCVMIDNFGVNQENIEINTLLKIILRLLVMDSIKQNITNLITTQQGTLASAKNSIICLIDSLMKKDLLHDEKIRGLLKEYIEKLTYTKVFDLSNLIKLAGLVGNCAASLTYDVGSITAKNTYNSALGLFYKKP